MKIPIPSEMLIALGYAETEWVVIDKPLQEVTRQTLLKTANTVLDRIAGALVSPISRTIPIQEFKEALLSMPNNQWRKDEE
jgi:hypothetical protein